MNLVAIVVVLGLFGVVAFLLTKYQLNIGLVIVILLLVGGVLALLSFSGLLSSGGDSNNSNYHQGAIDLPYLEGRWRSRGFNDDADGADGTACGASGCPCGVNTCGLLPAWNAMTGAACRDFHNKGPQFIVQHPVYQ